MEGENRTEQLNYVPKNNKYIVNTRRDGDMVATFVKFYNRVKHPRVTFNLLVLGIVFLVLPNRIEGMGNAGVIISYAAGAVMVLMGLFRHYIGINSMKSNPDYIEGEEISYQFGNSGVRTQKNSQVDTMGYYKDIYRIWEDEKNYFLGMNNDDLLVLPKRDFEEGDVSGFKYFIMEKSGADYKWQPAGFVNQMKAILEGMKKTMTAIDLDGSK